MAIARKLTVVQETVFPLPPFLVGAVEPVLNFDPEVRRPDGSRPQQLDKETGLPIWQVAVLDPDPEAGNREKTVVVKIVAQHQPVPPENKSGFPFTPVRFTGLTLTPWIDDNGPRPKLAWSIRATGFEDIAPTTAPTGRDQGKAA